MFKYLKFFNRHLYTINKNLSTAPNKFETVFTFPLVKYFALYNRLKIYHCIGSAAIIPITSVLETLETVPAQTCLVSSAIGITAAALLSITSLASKNIIGFIYISKDDKEIKLSYVDYWGRRKDRVISTDEWLPLLSLDPSYSDVLYLKPRLKDGTKFKLFIKHGIIRNNKKVSNILE